MDTFLKIKSKDRAKEFIIQKMYKQWIIDNPGLEEDIIKLSEQIVIFNIKWGTKIDIKD